MAIREIKLGCSLDPNERRDYQGRTGTEIHWPQIHLSSVKDDYELKLYQNPEHLALFYTKSDTLSHCGRVVAIEVDRGVRIMSDVWADLTYAVVYEPEGPEARGADAILEHVEKGWAPKSHLRSLFRRIQIGNSEFGCLPGEVVRAEADAPQWLLDVYEVYKAGKYWIAASARYDAAEHRTQDIRRTVDKGKLVRVTRGRKVPVGTEGLVFWTGPSQWGAKVGIALPQEDGTYRKEQRVGRRGTTYESYADVAWTYVKNCQVIDRLGGRIL